jgi:O-acetyl-ADP-ribose deacetylase (regulator of RNase III)
MEKTLAQGKSLRLLLGDITKIRVDAMVNAANSYLAGGGGVDGAIHRVGGPTLMKELDVIRAESGHCPPGGAVVTSAGALPALSVFHAVGPIYRDGAQGEPEQLRSCYQTCLDLAEARDARTVSFPAISTGAYGYPIQEAAEIAIGTIAAHLRSPEAKIREVLLVLWDQGSYNVHAKVLSHTPAG